MICTLRNLTFRFVFAPSAPPKSDDDLHGYATAGSGSIQGQKDAGLRNTTARLGIPDDVAIASARRFKSACDAFERRLQRTPFLTRRQYDSHRRGVVRLCRTASLDRLSHVPLAPAFESLVCETVGS